jgi:ankyrin repeat protein
VDPVNKRYLTPLNMAASKGHDQAVKILLEHGADVRCYFPSFLVALVTS